MVTDTEYLGAGAGQMLKWKPRSGMHEVRVVDERGQSGAVSVKVRGVQ